jgi:hypothetical protein
MSAFMHSAVSFGMPNMPPPDVGSSIGPISLHNAIEDYEASCPDMGETNELRERLIRTDEAWYLPEPHIRSAHHLIAVGYITPEGKITAKGRALILNEGREGPRATLTRR